VVDFEGEQTLAQRKPRLEPLKGDASMFQVQGMGACGNQGQACCWQDENLDYCEPGLSCEQGRCVQKMVCEPDTARCEGPHTLVTCNASGTDEDVTQCAADEECRGDRCVPMARPCTPGHPSCSADGTAVIACEDESRRHVRKDCAPGSLCRTGDCYDIEAASVTFDVRMPPEAPEAPEAPRYGQPGEKAWLLCSVGSERITWQLDQPPDLRPVSRTITVPFLPQRPGAPLEISCWLKRAQPREDVQSRRHPWTRDSEGMHRFRVAGMAGMQVVYTIRIHLTAPGSEAASGRNQYQQRSQQRPQQRPPERQPERQQQSPGDKQGGASGGASSAPRRTQQPSSTPEPQ